MADTPLRIAFDASPLNHPFFCGIQRYLMGLLRGLSQLKLEDRFLLVGINKPLDFFQTSFEVCGPQLPSGHGGWLDSVFSFLGHVHDVDLLFRAWGTLPERRSCPGILVVHDVIPLLFPQWACQPAVVKFFKETFSQKLPYVDAIITVSEQSKKDFLQFYDYNPDHIHVIYHGIEQKFFQTTSKKYPILQNDVFFKSPYLLSVGVLEPRKNYERLIHAYNHLRTNYPHFNWPLVIVGGLGWGYESILSAIKNSPFKADILLLGSVEDDLLLSLYAYAEIFIYPSLYEGFGLPVLEAMAAEKPCIIGKNSSLQEIGSNVAFYVDVMDIGSIAEGIYHLYLNPELRKNKGMKGRLHAATFTWEKTALETIKIFRHYGS